MGHATDLRVDGPMAPADAMWHWFSSKFDTDQFLIFAFAGVPASLPEAITATLARARAIPYLGVRISPDRFGLRFPRWVPCEVRQSQCAVHRLPQQTWSACLDAVAGLIGRQLDKTVLTWRLHVFPEATEVPQLNGPATVVVLQIAHALGDGPRTAAIAGALFGRDGLPPALAPARPTPMLRSIAAAVRGRRELARDTKLGKVPAPRAPAPALSPNAKPSGTLVLRTVVRDKTSLPGPTVTVGALVAVSEALSSYLGHRGEDVSRLAAAVPSARDGKPLGYNHIELAMIGLHADASSRAERVRAIVADLVDWRRRSQHPAFGADAAAAVPAPLRRLGLMLVRTDKRPATVPAHTVVSSVDRGPADLEFGGRPVVITAGFPALLPISSLTHGVHCIGDRVTITVHAAVPQIDVDDYVQRLEAALPD